MFGYNEKRLFNRKLINPNVDLYKKLFDIKIEEKNELYVHFLYNYDVFLKKFNNIFYHFDIEYYKNKYTDLKNLDYKELEKHFLFNGINEHRIFNINLENLNVSFYDKFISKKNVVLVHDKFINFLNNYDKYIEKFNLLYNIETKNKILTKDEYRKECEKEIKLIQNIIIKEDDIVDIDYETVFIEFRKLEHIEYIVKNVIIKLPNWKHTIVCGNINYDFIKKIVGNLQVNIIKLNIDTCEINNYNDLLLSKNFWMNFNSKKLLLYQEDTFLFHSKTIKDYLKYDYVGAPWPKDQNDNKLGVGNGGFSLRNPNIMIKCLELNNLDKLEINESTKKYMKNVNLKKCPEDVYFSKTIIENKFGSIPDRIISKEFSQETNISINPIGGHNFFMYHTNLSFKYNTLRLFDDNYYLSVNHRGGWKTIISNLKNNKLINPTGNLLFIDNVDKYFIWENNIEISTDWVGILHLTKNCPKYLCKNLSLESLLTLKFENSLKKCKLLITFNENIYSFMKNKYKNLNIKFMYHPHNEIQINKFDISKFKNYNKYNLVLLGQQLRKISDIFSINSNLIKEKVWLSGIKDKLSISNLLTNDIKYNSLKIIDSDKLRSDIYFNNYEEYDKYIINNIIIIPLYDSSANNSILEIIFLNCPAFITKLDSTIKYLGKDYPMFYENVNEINNILKSKNELIELYIKTHNYLKNLDKSRFDIKLFNSDLLKYINNIN